MSAVLSRPNSVTGAESPALSWESRFRVTVNTTDALGVLRMSRLSSNNLLVYELRGGKF